MERPWLAEFRNIKGMTHEQIANQANISRQYYGMIENGDRIPSVLVAKKIGTILDFDWTIFFANGSNVVLLTTTA